MQKPHAQKTSMGHPKNQKQIPRRGGQAAGRPCPDGSPFMKQLLEAGTEKLRRRVPAEEHAGIREADRRTPKNRRRKQIPRLSAKAGRHGPFLRPFLRQGKQGKQGKRDGPPGKSKAERR